MTIEEKRSILAKRLAVFRSWPYERLAERIKRREFGSDFLEHVEGEAPDGTMWQIEFNVFWDDEPRGDLRVMGSLTTAPREIVVPFVIVTTPDVCDAFIKRPDGTFVGE